MTISASYPFTLTNGTVADATQVMANFLQIQSDVNNFAAHNGANSDITSLSGLTTPLSIVQGGTGSTTAAGALTNLGAMPASGGTITGNLVIGSGFNITLTQGVINEAEATATACAATINLDNMNGNFGHITGNTGPVSSLVLAQGHERWVFFDSNPILQNNSNLLLPTRQNIQVTAGDVACFRGDAGGVVVCTAYLKVNGGSLIASQLVPQMIFGLVPSSVSGSSTTGVVTVNDGGAVDSTGSVVIPGTSLPTWQVSNGNNINGYQGGTTLPASTTIHFFLCQGASGIGLFGAATRSPTIPAGYNTSSRRIFSLFTDPSGALRPGTAFESEGGSYEYVYTQDQNSVVTGTVPSTTGTNYPQLVPLSFPVQVNVNCMYTSANNTAAYALLTSPMSANSVPSATLFTMGQPNAGIQTIVGATMRIWTDAAGNVRFRATNAGVSSNLIMYTVSYVDPRSAG